MIRRERKNIYIYRCPFYVKIKWLPLLYGMSYTSGPGYFIGIYAPRTKSTDEIMPWPSKAYQLMVVLKLKKIAIPESHINHMINCT